MTISDDEPLPSTLDVDAVRRAWTLARDNDAIPLLTIGIEPTEVLGSVTARLESLYVVTRDDNPVDVTSDVDRIIEFRAQPAAAYGFDMDEALHKGLWFDGPAGTASGGSVVLWDWSAYNPAREWIVPFHVPPLTD